MADSLIKLVQWSTSSYSIGEFLANYEPRFPILALVVSVGAPSKTAYILSSTEKIYVGQVLKVDSATEGQRRLIIEVAQQGLTLNIPLDCPAKFDIPDMKKKKLKLKKIILSSKYTLPLDVETSSKYSAYFEKAGAKPTGNDKKRIVKMVFKKVTEERFLKTNFIVEGIESPLVTFISADLPIELAIVESYVRPGTQEHLRDMYQLSPMTGKPKAKAKAKLIGKRKKSPSGDQLVNGAGLYIMAETSSNNNYITTEDSSASFEAAAAAAAGIEDDVDEIDMEDFHDQDAVQDTALNSEQSQGINTAATAAAATDAAATAAELKENSRQRKDDLSASSSEHSDQNVSQSVVDGVNGVTTAAGTATAESVERANEKDTSPKEEDAKMKQMPVSRDTVSQQSSLLSVQVNRSQSNSEEARQNSKSAATNGQLAKPEANHQVRLESPESGTAKQIHEDRRRQNETGTTELNSKTNSFDADSLESEESFKGPQELNASERIEVYDEEDTQRNRITTNMPATPELNRPSSIPRQTLRSKKPVAQNFVTEMNLGSTGVFCVELLPLTQSDSENPKLSYRGSTRNQISMSDGEDETPNETFSEAENDHIRINLMAPPSQKRHVSAKSASCNDSFLVSPKNDVEKEEFFFDESFVSPSPHTKTHYANGIGSYRNAGSTIITAFESTEMSRSSGKRTQPNTFSLSKTPLRQAYSLDRRLTYQSTEPRVKSHNTDDASTQTMFCPTINSRTIDEDSVKIVATRSIDRRLSKTIVQLSGPHQLLSGGVAERDKPHEGKLRRKDSIIQRIILNDSEEATCKITSFTSTPSNDRSSVANISYRIPSFRTEPVSVPSSYTLPWKWTSSTPLQPQPRTSSSSNTSRHVFTVELLPYSVDSSDATRFTSLIHESPERSRVVEAPSERLVYGVVEQDYSKSTPNLAIRPVDASSRFQSTADTDFGPLSPNNLKTRESRLTSYEERINNHEDRTGLSINRQARARQQRGQDGFHQSSSRTEIKKEDGNAQMSPITNGNVVMTTRNGGDNKSGKMIGRSRTTVWETARNLYQSEGRRTRSEEQFQDEEEARRAAKAGRTVEHLHRTKTKGTPIRIARTQELDRQSYLNEGVPEYVSRSNLVVTTTERVRQSNTNKMTPEQNLYFASNGKTSDIIKHRSSNRRTSEQSVSRDLRTPEQARHAHRKIETFEKSDHRDGSVEILSHRPRRNNFTIDATENRRIEQIRPRFTVRASEKVSNPSHDVTTPRESRCSNTLERTPLPVQHSLVQHSKPKMQTSETQRDESRLNVRRSDQVRHATWKENSARQINGNIANMKQNRKLDLFPIYATENEFASTGNSRRGSTRNDDIKTISIETEKRTQKKTRHQPSQDHREITTAVKSAAAAAASGDTQNKQQNHSQGTTTENKMQLPLSTEFSKSAAPDVEVNAEHKKSSHGPNASANVPSSTPKELSQKPQSQTVSNGIGNTRQKTGAKRRRNKEIPADEELTYPIDTTVRKTIFDLDSFLKEQDPDAQSTASSQFVEQHELMIHHDLAGISHF